MQRLSRKGGSRPCQSNAATAASKKEIDERRLRKLKVYLRSVSYNGSEGMPKFPTLQDLYEDTILSEEFPCDTMKLTSRHHCAPTPFLIACCFNRRYPVNGKKRAENLKTKPSINRHMENLSNSPSTSFTTKQQIASSGARQTTKKSNVQDKANTSIELRKPHAASIRQLRKPANKNENAKILIEKDNCVVNGNENEILTVSKNVELPTQIRDLETQNNKTTKTEKRQSGSKIENCETSRKNAPSYQDKDESTEPDKMKTETSSRKVGSKEVVWTEKRGSSNENICSGTFSTLNKNPSCDSSLVQTTHVENQGIMDKTSNISITAMSQEEIKLRDIDQTRSACNKVDNNAKVSDEPAREREKEISVHPARRNSLRSITSSDKNKTTMALQDRDKSVQKRNVKFPEKMKPNTSENAGNRLRSRAVIKQPGHKNQYKKGHPRREK